MDSNQSRGLMWKKIDLHMHTPASKEDRVDKSVRAADIIQRAKELKLDAICVSDHNTGDWIDKVKLAAHKTGITVFPGVEITAQGGERNVHVLGVFDPSKGTAYVNDLLAKLDIVDDKRGRTDILAKGSVNQVLDTISEMGGLPLLAHADSQSGVLKEIKGIARVEIVQNPRLMGVNVTNTETSRFLDGRDREYRRKLGTFLASDAHNPQEIGQHVTYFKMGVMNISALRQCFNDPETRITHTEAIERPYPRIQSLEFSGGFLSGSKCLFHPGLNSLIGGTGVGKSLVIEFLRFVLEQPSAVPVIKDDMESKLALRLGLGGSVTAVIQSADAAIYRVTRTYDRLDNPTEVHHVSQGTAIDAHVRKLLPILCYSQNEIIDISRSPSAQLELIDRLIDIDAYDSRIRELQATLKKNLTSYFESRSATEDIEQMHKEIADLGEEIKQLSAVLDNPMFALKKKLDQQNLVVKNIDKKSAELESDIEQFVKSHLDIGLPGLSDEDKAETNLVSLHSAVEKAASEFLDNMRGGLKKYKKAIQKASSFEKLFLRTLGTQEKKYAEFIKGVGGEKQALARKRTLKQSRIDELNDKLAKLKSKAEKLGELQGQRNSLLAQLEKAVSERYDARAGVFKRLTELSEGRLNLTIQSLSDRSKFFNKLVELLYGTRTRTSSITALSVGLTPTEFMKCIMGTKVDELARAGDLSVDIAERVITSIRSDESKTKAVLGLPIDEIPADVPRIEFRKNDGKYYPLNELSTGQKCTALLLIAFSQGSMPVIVDQPEDALDVATVYHDIVSRLRGGKENRQFILTTHNPNIAVVSDSDKFHVLEATQDAGQIVCCGAIDLENVRNAVIYQLEGGVEPYRIRGKKYEINEKTEIGL